ncbi:ABC transporter transmembrane domain-containing protein [Crocosphaera sp. UHCC 0190]|uniref:ABC transporter transmembrane domain-containing protein n=1 Tax=Crocosphaera sp. UHCC 0190 TaxID=3110246 RepID=UPI002B203921|nr:ABC transporter transmembrane domain-containing protein [Crocosphaera sp. UHCC 0190]MEA5512274.1 ABC transporter transmembrane domain-containing protein [Crocosphaera sp. UHCC 0190]
MKNYLFSPSEETNKLTLQSGEKNQQIIQRIRQILESISETDDPGQDLANKFEILGFNWGEIITNLPKEPQTTGQNSVSSSDVYLICQGQVRLVSFHQGKEREVSINLLREGDVFGGDSVWNEIIWPYQAIAAGTVPTASVQVAKISQQTLKPYLDKLPKLQAHWQTEAKQRQTLIFFKTFTELGDLSSRRLQQLLPYVRERQIPAGENLAAIAKKEPSHCWLRQGQIKSYPLNIGSAWGYPAKIPPDWVAQSELYLYQILASDWDKVKAIAPMLDPTSENPSVPIPAPTLPPPREAIAPTPSPIITPPDRETPEINFPKPLKRRRKLWQNYPFIEQQSSADCGATCLAMISQYWGKRLSLNFLRDLAGVGRSGASLKNLARAAESLGYQARPVRASLNRLVEEKNPWIAHWQGDHYVVVYRVKGDRLLVADPAKGKRFIPRQEFLAGWTGYALLLDPTEGLNQVPTEKRSLGRFLRLLLPYRNISIQVILASFLIQIFGLVSPLFTQIILDKVVVNKSLTTLNVFAIGVLLFGIWSVLLSGVRQYLLSYLSNRLDLTMIGGFIRHALLLPLRFFESRHVGDIITRVNENQKIQQFLLNQVVLAWLDFLMGFVYLGLMLYYNWQLTLLIVALIPPIMLLTLGATPLLRHVSREVFNRSAEQNSALVETITGVATIKATATERELRWRWEDHLTNYLNARFRGQKLGINLQAASGLINSIGSTALLWYGATLVIQDHLTIGQFVAFNMMIGKVLSPVLSMANLWDELQEVLISVERLNDIFDTKPEETPGQPMLQLPLIKGDVKFDNVTFRYDLDEERNTLQNISFAVKAGQTVAIVGRSGSGKTTLVKLLQGLYQVEQGKICIDDHDLHHVSPHSLRSQLGVVPQECFLFSGTILDNITLYRPEFSLDQAIKAAQLAEAHAFIQSMPLGYNTKVGERGTNLSGGQRQRIAIARALLGEPRILILDEATSSLDTESERRFQQNLTRLSRNRTTFIIAHRLSTVRNADCILVLERGILAEKGTHEELIALKGIYAHLAEQQLNL